MPSVKLGLGFSPCPNDTFIFYALIHKKIAMAGLEFKETLLDVETLNQKAFNAELDITKVSFHAYALLRDKYSLLRSGGAMGRGCGPLIVGRAKNTPASLQGKKIAIPGNLTTAFLLLRLYDPELAKNVIIMPFDRIMGAVKNNLADAGLIIHESRFTYPQYGLYEILDLGKWWEAETGLPIPLGCIIARKTLGRKTINTAGLLIRKSIAYALANAEEAMNYIKIHSQETDEAVIKQHINLYVNNYSLDFGIDGMHAIEELFKRTADKNITGRSKKQ